MNSATREHEAPAVTAEYVNVLLGKTDWSEYTRRVVEKVAKKAEYYREAQAKATALASQRVFV